MTKTASSKKLPLRPELTLQEAHFARFGFKLLRLRRDGTLGPLFIDRGLRIEVGEWMAAKCVPTKGYAVRPGWHVCSKQSAPHLTSGAIAAERVWAKVEMGGLVTEHTRPEAQGGLWYTATCMRVLKILGPAR